MLRGQGHHITCVKQLFCDWCCETLTNFNGRRKIGTSGHGYCTWVTVADGREWVWTVVCHVTSWPVLAVHLNCYEACVNETTVTSMCWWCLLKPSTFSGMLNLDDISRFVRDMTDLIDEPETGDNEVVINCFNRLFVCAQLLFWHSVAVKNYSFINRSIKNQLMPSLCWAGPTWQHESWWNVAKKRGKLERKCVIKKCNLRWHFEVTVLSVEKFRSRGSSNAECFPGTWSSSRLDLMPGSPRFMLDGKSKNPKVPNLLAFPHHF